MLKTETRLEIERLEKLIKELRARLNYLDPGTEKRPSQVVIYQTSTGGGGGGFVARFILAYYLEDPIQIANDVTDNWRQVEFNVTLTRAKVQLKSGPSEGSLILDVKKSSNFGVSWASIFSSGITVGNGQEVSAEITSFAISSLVQGDLLRLDILEAGANEVVRGELILVGGAA